MCSGAAAELNVWTALSDQPLSAEQAAEKLGCDRRAITVLLDAAASLDLLEKHEQRYGVSPKLRAWLVEGGGESVLPMLQHSMSLVRGWSQLAWVAKAGIPAPRSSSIRGPAADRASFIAAMHSISGPMADELVHRLGPPKFRRLLDVGGASGTWTLAFLRAALGAVATIFDLPDAIVQARERLLHTEFADRVTLVSGDFYVDDLPDGADFAWLDAICHQHSRRHNRALFAKVFHAIVPGGRIALRDVVMKPGRTQPFEGALFAVNMLVNTDGGSTYTFDEYAEDLRTAGFAEPRLAIEHEAMHSVIVASKE